MARQPTFFQETEIDQFIDELVSTKAQLNNLRRGIFGRYDEMCHEMQKLQSEVNSLKEQIIEKKPSKILELPLQING